MSAPPHVTFVCTGNAARSVMARVMFEDRAGSAFTASGAGTLVIDGQPMSSRTRNALARYGLADPHHRSRQLDAGQIEQADLLVVMEPSHVQWVRKRHPAGADRTATLKRLVRDLPGTAGTLPDRVASLQLATLEVEAWEEVVDPAAGEQDAFDACARELDALVDSLLVTMTNGVRSP